MQPITVGDARIAEIVQGRMKSEPAGFLPTSTPEAIARHREWMAPLFMDRIGRLVLTMRAWVVRTPQHTILVDTCIGNDKKRRVEPANMLKSPFLEDLKAVGVTPEQVDYVMCTHLHWDHVGWNTRLENGRWVPAFPRAKYLFGRAEWEHFKTGAEGDTAEAHRDSVIPIIEAGKAVMVDPGHRIGEDLQIIPLPGHTPGHAGLHLRSRGREAIFTGDMMHSPLQIAEPQWSTSACVDPAVSAATRASFVKKHADTDTIIIAAHFPDPAVGTIVSHGDSWRLKC